MKQLLVLFILCLSISSNGQYAIGYTAGYQMSGAIDTKTELFQHAPKIGFNLGVGLDINLFKDISIEPMLLYSRKGWNETSNIGIQNIKTLHYLSTQLVAKYHLTEEYKIIGGPEFSYLLKAKSSLNTNAIIRDYNPKDIGFFIGMELTFWDIISFNVKYNFGLNNVSEETINDLDGNNLGTLNIKNRAFMYGVTFYPFKGNKK